MMKTKPIKETFMKRLKGVFAMSLILFASVLTAGPVAATQPQTIELANDWLVQAAARVPQPGEIIANRNFSAKDWYPTSVPATVLAVLAANNVYKDIFFGKNLETIPVDQFKGSWWYRCEFSQPPSASFANARLIFEGINFRANVFLNGQ
jgi:exo-1,4-beta-D-glucosaminidase